MPTAELPRRWAWWLLAGVLALGLGLRLWGIRQGLPYAYNADEADHFVPRAVSMFAHGLNPHYFANPPAYTYLLHILFSIAYGGGHGVLHEFAFHPASVYTLARAAAAVLGVLALWLTYLAGARLIGRAGGLIAAAIEAVAFLPTYYSHVAVNDVPTLAPLALSLLGSAGVLRTGRTREVLLAAAGLGLACASKYTAGVALAPLLAAIAANYVRAGSGAERRALAHLGLAAAVSLGFFLLANPYSVLDYSAFHSGVIHESTLTSEAQGKLGEPRHGGLLYYLWSLTWGLGWAPALAALGGAIAVWRRERALGWLLVPAPVGFLIFMGLQGRYFGRWLMPIVPILCLLAALFVLQLASAAGGAWARVRAGRVRVGTASAAASALLSSALLAQGLTHSIHSGLVLSRADTRNLTRAWLVAHVPRGAAIVAEPVSPDEWARETRPGTATSRNLYRWKKYASLESRITPSGALSSARPRSVTLENYVRTLSPALLGYYERNGYCWVISGSTQSGRALADPRAVPHAIAYYRALEREGEVVYRASPYARGAGPVAFGFDWSFNYYPLSYERPGPAMTVYRLHGGRCGP
ncbi:MAG TPA: glycosyltransferase family 39 protein [Solirubrobacteraceae bacterium]|nr:glycosyltransferase family 39 protein [Solirubrobacteraceae bacterium]